MYQSITNKPNNYLTTSFGHAIAKTPQRWPQGWQNKTIPNPNRSQQYHRHVSAMDRQSRPIQQARWPKQSNSSLSHQRFQKHTPPRTKSKPEILHRRNPSAGWHQNSRQHPPDERLPPRCPSLLRELILPTKKEHNSQ